MTNTSNFSGGRISTPWLRRLNEQANQFKGLPEGVGRFDLLRLLKRVGRKLGFTTTMINHLEYLVCHTKDCDWQDGGRPIVYKTVISQSMDLGISDRQVANRENHLHELGALTWTDTGNHRRMGYRNKDDQIVSAFGVNLAPLASLYPVMLGMEIVLDRLQHHWKSLKQSVSSLRRQILALSGELETVNRFRSRIFTIQTLPEMVKRIRASISIDGLYDIRNELLSIVSELRLMIVGATEGVQIDNEQPVENASWTKKISAQAEENFRHKYNTNKQLSLSERCKRILGNTVEAFSPSPEDRQQAIQGKVCTTGIEHIRLGSVLAAISDEFKQWLPVNQQIDWSCILSAAEYRAQELNIPRHTWIEACQTLGREAASTAIVIIDRNKHHPTNSIRNPSAFLYGMIAKAKTGELALHRSLFGVLARDRDHSHDPSL